MPGVTTFRPGGVRVIAYGVAVVIVVVAYAIARALPENIVFTGAQIGTLAIIYLGIVVGLHGIARSFVRMTDAGLEIRNGYRFHRLAWSDIRGVSMPAGAPWPTLVHGDDERLMLFALQRSDGPRAAKAVDAIVRRVP